MNINNFITEIVEKRDRVWFGPAGGYWSNLDKEESKKFLKDLPVLGARKTVEYYFPQYFNVIFSPKRAGGLPLLDPQPGEVIVDVGCMWGALTVYLAKAGCAVIAIDQTLESLRLLQQRLVDESLTNVEVVCSDLKKISYREASVDTFVVNGVLEWIPETGTIELKKCYGKKIAKTDDCRSRPDDLQKDFLRNLYLGLKKGGKLYLAIENRFDFKMFFGCPDPHVNLPFVSLLPRRIADVISRMRLGRPYINWLYSFGGIKALLSESGFSRIDLYMCFPDYRYPERIIPYSGSLRGFEPTIKLVNEKGQRPFKRLLARLGEFIIFNKLRLKILAPSIIAIAQK